MRPLHATSWGVFLLLADLAFTHGEGSVSNTTQHSGCHVTARNAGSSGGSCPFFISQMFHLWVGNWHHTNSNLPRFLAVIKIYVEEAFNSDVKQS